MKQSKAPARGNIFTEITLDVKAQMIVVFVFACVLYINTLSHNYALDDGPFIARNIYTQKGFAGIWDILTNDAFAGAGQESKFLLPGGRYRPLSQITFAIEYQLFGLHPFFGHFFNILYYGALCVLVLLTLRKIFEAYHAEQRWYMSLPFVATLLFAAHPLHTEVVANIKGRDEIFTMIGSVAALYCTLEYIKTSKPLFLLYSFIAFFLGLMSKETTVTFIAVIPLTLYFFTQSSFKQIIITLLPLLIATAIFVFIRQRALGVLVSDTINPELLNNPFLECTISQRYATICYTLWKYLMLLFFPFKLTHDYYPFQIPIISWSDPRAFLPLLVFVALVVLSISGLFKKKFVAYCIIFYLATLSVASNIVVNVGTFMNERFLFIPSLGFALLAAYFLIEILKKYFADHERFVFNVTTIIVVILAFYSLRTVVRNMAWKDNLTLALSDVKTSAKSARCTAFTGFEYLLKSKEEGVDTVQKVEYLKNSLDYMRRSLMLYPNNAIVWYHSGDACFQLNDLGNAVTCFENVLDRTKYDKTVGMLVRTAEKAVKFKQFEVAMRAQHLILKNEPDSVVHYANFAGIYEAEGNYDSAIIILQNALKKFPKELTLYEKLGKIYGQIKNEPVAAAYFFEKAHALDTTNGPILLSLGFVYGMMNDNGKAIYYFEKAYTLYPNDLQTLMILGFAYGQVKQYQKAIDILEKALKLDPMNPQINQDLAVNYHILGIESKANEYLAKAKQVSAQQR